MLTRLKQLLLYVFSTLVDSSLPQRTFTRWNASFESVSKAARRAMCVHRCRLILSYKLVPALFCPSISRDLLPRHSRHTRSTRHKSHRPRTSLPLICIEVHTSPDRRSAAFARHFWTGRGSVKIATCLERHGFVTATCAEWLILV